MDKKTYVTRLKKMLNRYADKSCSHCPAAKYYSAGILFVSPEECQICQKFVHLKVVEYYLDFDETCPCFRPNAETAVKRALKHIALYEEKHGEIKI